jgi:hypothetical protein
VLSLLRQSKDFVIALQKVAEQAFVVQPADKVTVQLLGDGVVIFVEDHRVFIHLPLVIKKLLDFFFHFQFNLFVFVKLLDYSKKL